MQSSVKQKLSAFLPKNPKKLQDRVAVWSEMNDLRIKFNCQSLGEGAPAGSPPQFLLDEMNKAMQE